MLIKDLNGNHVIQKCLNKLAPEDNQVRAFAFGMDAYQFTCGVHSSFTMQLRPTASRSLHTAMAAACFSVALTTLPNTNVFSS